MSFLASLTSTITSAVSQLPSSDQLVEAEKMQLLRALDGLRAVIEPPMVTLQNLTQAVGDPLDCLQNIQED